ncbi:unnamed protein product [Rotaria sp. Silwood2]|nr:unnamed protein product [Rotaria sp. Silwood2]CAF4258454.1 unnamed protein product [Rotaria sp. Silwood2]
MDIPFLLIAGEAYINDERLPARIIHVTTYRLFISPTESSYSSIDCPIRSIDSIVMKDDIYLNIQCKHIRSFRLKFVTKNQRDYWFRKLDDMIVLPTYLWAIHKGYGPLDDLFAIKFASDIRKDEHSYHDLFNVELIRLQLDTCPWRLTKINENYELCTSYPKYCVVPSIITDEEISEAAEFRSYKRFPTIVWRHANGAIIARASQPEVSWLLRRSKEDEKMIQAIINACNGETNSNRLLILHLGTRDAAIENYAKYYPDCDVKFMNLPDIHATRRSARMLSAVNAAQDKNYYSQLASTQWLQYLLALIKAASCVVANVNKHNRSVLVHCSNG